ncbi:MAG: Asp-tRNA(Asn)/Glu-tRNA(Gln) amidotransferase subunit GatA [Chloroflexi bacterium]|nr:Asp-tRNA(Asn)/Glu-tRNA(Gln) amidotransferase subunit GatA [Chloroflexota bacterium]
MPNMATLTIGQLAPLIQRREVSPVEVTREILDRMATVDKRINSFITVGADRAMAEARVAEEEIIQGGYRGPLHGIPLGIKDNIAVVGWPTTCGSALLRDRVTDFDATVVQRFRETGAVIVGKTTLHEWAMGGTCSTHFYGTTHNPWNLDRVPGGSSGGSAAAVSASLIYGSVGTDGYGSIRTPSSYCGVVGFKPTYGLVSRLGELPPSSSTSDHIGPIAKDVHEAAILLNTIAGYDPNDPTSLRSRPLDYTARLDADVEGIRIGVPTSFFFERAAPEVRSLVSAAIDALGALGAEVHEVQTPPVRYMPFITAASATEGAASLLPHALQGPQNFADQSIWERVILGQFMRSVDMLKASRIRNLLRREFAQLMETVDVLALPTNITPAFPIDVKGELAGGKPGGDTSYTSVLTVPFNYVGMPAISVPCGFTSNGLPVGLMIAGRHWEDHRVLQMAYAAQQATTGGYRFPPAAVA